MNSHVYTNITLSDIVNYAWIGQFGGGGKQKPFGTVISLFTNLHYTAVTTRPAGAWVSLSSAIVRPAKRPISVSNSNPNWSNFSSKVRIMSSCALVTRTNW